MDIKQKNYKSVQLILLFVLLIMIIVPGCNLPYEDPARGTATQQNITRKTQAFESLQQTAAANMGEKPTPVSIGSVEPTETQTSAPTPEATADPNRKAPDLPAAFQTDLLNKLDYPHTYISDTCEFLKNRWSAGKAEPGTIVLPIMYHGIMEGTADQLTVNNQITSDQHLAIAKNLKDQGFEAIDTEQFIAFMKNNDYIPARSFMFIVDDRHYGSYFGDHFKPLYDQYGWKVVNAWISAEGTTQDLWDQNAAVEAAGYVDHQAHGVVHNVNMSDESSDEYLTSELQGSIDAIQSHFGKTPHAIIWPGGSFGSRPIEFAKKFGYEVGFTVNPRGPVMYNWVPLCDETDPGRPSYIADGKMDPLFVIPRMWDTDVSEHLDTMRQIGKAAKEEIIANRDIELEYYDIVCKAKYGEIQ